MITPLDTPCIEFQGSRDSSGYGQKRVNGVLRGTHIRAYEDKHGPVPKGMCVLHKCDNRPCMNVDHLFLGTRGDNNADRKAKGRNACTKGENHPSNILTQEQVDTIRERLKEPYRGINRDLAFEFGVHYSTISKIKKGKLWLT